MDLDLRIFRYLDWKENQNTKKEKHFFLQCFFGYTQNLMADSYRNCLCQNIADLQLIQANLAIKKDVGNDSLNLRSDIRLKFSLNLFIL